MKVKCIYNNGINLPKDIFVEGSGYTEASTFPLKIDKDYVVYAMTIKNGYVWYYLCNENFCYYPVWSPSPLFEIIDHKLSRYWVFSYKKGINYIKAFPRWAYPEWAENPDYYDKLTDGDKKEVNIFKTYKELMDLEFPDYCTIEWAQVGDQEWLICPKCINAWESRNNKNALVRCPNCETILNNSRYKKEFWTGLEPEDISDGKNHSESATS